MPLTALMRGMVTHPSLAARWALKGGTALNLFVFDAPRLSIDLDANYPARLRLAFVVYGAMSRTDWRTVSPAQVTFDPVELKNKLVPLLRAGSPFHTPGQLEWMEQMVVECRAALAAVLPLTDAERDFLDGVLDRGDIDPGPLTTDPDLAARIVAQPHLQWKADHVRRHRTWPLDRPVPAP